ncbi:class F sortase [Kribbella sp. NPDC023972]|uniref:class F sortase n=1 Tax=Kribbella sp. NPDC023972 TaxID=3154795 RepID=UPI0033DDBBD0
MILTRGAAILAMAALPIAGLFAGCAAPDGASSGGRGERTEQTASEAVSPPPVPPAPSPTLGEGGIRTQPADPPALTKAAQPVRLQLASVGIDIPVVAVGVASDGQMELPPDPAMIGWYRFGPSTTDLRGAVVLAGHVDSKQYGVGPLVRLRELRLDALVTVQLSDSTVTRYRVQTVENIPKTSTALDQVFDRDGARLLRVITCGGPYDRNGGGYRDNLVVTARPA